MPTLSVHVDDNVFEEVNSLASQWDRSASWIVRDALKPYLEHQKWMVTETTSALADLHSGQSELIDHNVVMTDLTEHARRLDECK